MILNNLHRIIENNPKLAQQYQVLSAKSKKNIATLLNSIDNKDGVKINNDYKFIISLCKELNKFDLQTTEIP